MLLKKQPTSPEELNQIIAAMEVSCVPRIRYAGAEPEILARLQEKGLGGRCDVLIPPEKIPPAGGDPGVRMINLNCALHSGTGRRIGKKGRKASPPE